MAPLILSVRHVSDVANVANRAGQPTKPPSDFPQQLSTAEVTTEIITPPEAMAPHTLALRQNEYVSTVPEAYSDSSGLSPGATAGIVLGSVAGFVLILAAIWWCVNWGSLPSFGDIDSSSVTTSSVVTRRTRPRSTTRTHRSKRSIHNSPRRRMQETVEIRRRSSGSRPRAIPVIVPAPRPDQIVVEEEPTTASSVTDRTSDSGTYSYTRSRVSSIPPPRAPRPPRAVPPSEFDEDEVVVIEEHSPPRHPPRRMSSERRNGRYRDGDPYRYSRASSRARSESRRGNGRRR